MQCMPPGKARRSGLSMGLVGGTGEGNAVSYLAGGFSYFSNFHSENGGTLISFSSVSFNLSRDWHASITRHLAMGSFLPGTMIKLGSFAWIEAGQECHLRGARESTVGRMLALPSWVRSLAPYKIPPWLQQEWFPEHRIGSKLWSSMGVASKQTGNKCHKSGGKDAHCSVPPPQKSGGFSEKAFWNVMP